jgi:hypothetical protein
MSPSRAGWNFDTIAAIEPNSGLYILNFQSSRAQACALQQAARTVMAMAKPIAADRIDGRFKTRS